MKHLALAMLLLAGVCAFAGNTPTPNRLSATLWQSLGLDADTVFSICVANNGTVLAGTFSQGVKRSTNDGVSWTTSTGLTGIRINGIADAQGALWAGTELNGLYKSTDGGTTWNKVSMPDPVPATVSVRKVTTNKNGWLFVSLYDALTDNFAGLGFTSDGGTSWGHANGPTNADGNITDIITAPNGTMFLAVKGTNGVLTSSDDGQNWSFTSMTQAYRVHSLGTDALGTLYAGTTIDPPNAPVADGIYRSTDNGAHWQACNTGVPSPSSFAAAGTIVTGNDGSVFAGSMSNGILRSSDHGNTWTLFNDGLKAPLSINLTKDSKGNVYSCGMGLYRTPTTTAAVGEQQSAVPAAFALKQNYPNPFNPTTTIQFSLAKAGEVRLSVFDMLGREVAVLANGAIAAGVHTVKFDAAGLSSGSYICRLQAGSSSASTMMMLVR